MTITNENILCISAIDWDFIWQGNQEIMSTLAAQGNTVLFIDNTGVRRPSWHDIPRLRQRIKNWRAGIKGVRKERENLFVYSPLILPFPYSRLARALNRILVLRVIKRWMRSVEFYNPIVWTFLPTGLALDIIRGIDPKLIIYYCIDNFEASSPGARRVRKTEEKLLQKADLVFVGPLQTGAERLKALANFHFLGPKDHSDLGHYIQTFDVAIIPYQLTESTAPVPSPQFYDPVRGNRWDQIRAFLHEYLGIIYYWWRGYV